MDKSVSCVRLPMEAGTYYNLFSSKFSFVNLVRLPKLSGKPCSLLFFSSIVSMLMHWPSSSGSV